MGTSPQRRWSFSRYPSRGCPGDRASRCVFVGGAAREHAGQRRQGGPERRADRHQECMHAAQFLDPSRWPARPPPPACHVAAGPERGGWVLSAPPSSNLSVTKKKRSRSAARGCGEQLPHPHPSAFAFAGRQTPPHTPPPHHQELPSRSFFDPCCSQTGRARTRHGDQLFLNGRRGAGGGGRPRAPPTRGGLPHR